MQPTDTWGGATHVQDYGYPPPYGYSEAYRPALPPPRRTTPRWLVVGALALAFMLALGVGAVVGANYLGTAQAASSNAGNGFFGQPLAGGTSTGTGAQGGAQGQGQCGTLTVSSVNGST